MAKFKITLKRDAVLSSDNDGIKTEAVAAEKREVVIAGKYCTEAVAQATKSNYGFYPIAWECIEADKKTPEELAEEAKNKKIIEEWNKKKQAEKKAAELDKKKEALADDKSFDGPDLYDADARNLEA